MCIGKFVLAPKKRSRNDHGLDPESFQDKKNDSKSMGYDDDSHYLQDATFAKEETSAFGPISFGPVTFGSSVESLST